jgi:hypothetical protein
VCPFPLIVIFLSIIIPSLKFIDSLLFNCTSLVKLSSPLELSDIDWFKFVKLVFSADIEDIDRKIDKIIKIINKYLFFKILNPP